MKKGFTLIELLAVIIILSILMILAVPQILKSLEEIKKQSFITEVQQIYKAAQHQYTVNAMTGTSVTCFNSVTSENKIQTSGEDLVYKISIQPDGTITDIYVYSPTMRYEYSKEISAVTDIVNDENLLINRESYDAASVSSCS